jgi:hypothetical protein
MILQGWQKPCEFLGQLCRRPDIILNNDKGMPFFTAMVLAARLEKGSQLAKRTISGRVAK